ncbi:unnamed protein product, partial [Prorocentrum cordatum]
MSRSSPSSTPASLHYSRFPGFFAGSTAGSRTWLASPEADQHTCCFKGEGAMLITVCVDDGVMSHSDKWHGVAAGARACYELEVHSAVATRMCSQFSPLLSASCSLPFGRRPRAAQTPRVDTPAG